MLQNFYGCYDLTPKRFNVVKTITDSIRKHGATMKLEEMSTPIIEYTDLLMSKYGDEAETKLIFNLKEHNKQSGSLRYDLTVPLMRYMVNNGLDHIRRLQIGPAFRRDKPYPESGRLCEFYQADCDIVGDYDPLTSESEIFWLISKVMKDIGVDNYLIKYNYRQNLVKMCNMIGIKSVKHIKDICATIDKADKITWDEIKTELKDVRNLTDKQIQSLCTLLEENYLDESIKDFDVKLTALVNNPKFSFDATLARGLDYYTGIIYEVVIPDSKIKTVIAGGRYDKLIYMNTKKKGKKYIPAIGVSFGLSRLELVAKLPETAKKSDIYVISQDLMMRLKLCEKFRDMGLVVDYEINKRKTIKSITFAVKNNFKYCAIYGENDDKVKIKVLANKDPDVEYLFDQIPFL